MKDQEEAEDADFEKLFNAATLQEIVCGQTDPPEDHARQEVCLRPERVVLIEFRPDGTELEHYRF